MTQPEQFSNPAASDHAPTAHRSKVLLALLASLLGVFGGQWWYLGRPKAWVITAFSVLVLAIAHLYPVWWDNPVFLLLAIPATVGFIEALVFALKPDDRFDAQYNPLSGRTTHTGWDAVIVAIVTVVLGGFVIVYTIVRTVIYVYVSMGWLDGYVV